MLYFAYGSNMNWDQMQDRCPSAQFICKAKLPNHRLEFTRQSKKRGVADAVKNSGSDIWGVIYEINNNDISRLDKKEGFRPGGNPNDNAYFRKECTVFKEGQQNSSLEVFIYFVQSKGGPYETDLEYKNLLVTGAKYWGLPKEYIEETLEQIKTID